MTIKEVEGRTGLARANIRYYEDQGFFSAARGENGYRDYSEENVDTLLKVKLLRQLGFSLEEIHSLQKGEDALEPALVRREASLEQGRRELDQAARLCRDMREDGVEFYTLDARRYLDRMVQTEEVAAQDRDPVRVFPWRRFFARALDIDLCSTLLEVLLQLTVRVNVIRLDENAGSSFLLKLGALVILAGVETLMLHFWGTTPGKALLGLKILREDGSPLSLAEAGRRTGLVMVFAGGSMLLSSIPFLPFVLAGVAMLIWACWRVYHEKPMFWEEEQLYLDGSTREKSFWENRRSWARVAGYLAVSAACIGLVVGGHFFAARPPHRGVDLTAEEFVDNYNRYMAFAYGEENLTRRLTLSGTFEDIPRDDGTVIFNVMENDRLPKPSFSFSQEEGRLNTVALTWKYDSSTPLGENQSYLISIPYQEVYTALRSLLWSQLGERGVTSVYKALVEEEGNYHTVLDGLRINSEMRFSGFLTFDDSTLWAETGQTQSCFVEFVIELT